jgi:hypothetical protein
MYRPLVVGCFYSGVAFEVLYIAPSQRYACRGSFGDVDR